MKPDPTKFQALPEDFIFLNETTKLEINKSELSKAINIFTQQSNEKKNKDFEDAAVDDMELWLKNVQKQITDEIEKFYG